MEASITDLETALAVAESSVSGMVETEAGDQVSSQEMTRAMAALKEQMQAELEKEKKAKQDYAKRAIEAGKQAKEMENKLNAAAQRVAEATSKQVSLERELSLKSKEIDDLRTALSTKTEEAGGAKELERSLRAEISVLKYGQEELQALRSKHAELKTCYEKSLSESVVLTQRISILEVRLTK